MAFSFATIRFFALIRQTMKVLLVLRYPQKWVKPKNVKTSGFLSFSTLFPVAGGKPPELETHARGALL
jgi:hypothetical protein